MSARPEYDASTALIVVDVQNDFASRRGSLSVKGGEQIIPRLNEEIARARDAGALVAYTQDWHPPATPHFAKDGGTWPVHCVQDSWGAELHPELDAPRGDDERPVVRKGSNGEDGYSGFTMRDPVSGEERPTQLEAQLQRHGVRRVVVGGLATDYCVRATALDAVRLGYATALLPDAVAAVDLKPGDGERAIAEMRTAGVEVD